MRDLITAFSGLIALAIFLYSMIVGADLEPTLWKTLIIFVCSNLIGYSAHGITSVTINSDFGDQMHQKDDLENSKSKTSENATVNA